MATSLQSPISLVNAALPSGSSYESVQEQFEVLPGEKSPLVSLFGYGPAVHMDDDQRTKVIVDKARPHTLTLAAQVDDTGTALTLSTTEAALLQLGTILRIDDERLRVTTVAASTTVGVSREFAGTTGATHVTSSTIHVMSPLFLTNSDFITGSTSRGEFKSFELFHTMDGFAVEDAASGYRSYLTKQQDPMTWWKSQRMMDMNAKLERTLLYSVAQQMTSSQIGAPAGIDQLITSNVTTVTGALTASDFVDTFEMLLSHGVVNIGDDMVLYGNRLTRRIFSALARQYFDVKAEPHTTSVGVKMDRFEFDFGSVSFIKEPAQSILDGELFILKTSDIKIHPLDMQAGLGNGWVEVTRDAAINNNRSQSIHYSLMAFLVMGDERRHAKITGFSTTRSDYAGFV